MNSTPQVSISDGVDSLDPEKIAELGSSSNLDIDVATPGPGSRYEKVTREALLNLVGGWLVMFATYGYIYSFGAYQDFYTRSNVASASSVSWIGSIQAFLVPSMGLISGRLLDLGYFRHTLAAGSLLYTLSLFMLSIAHPTRYYQIFLAQGIGMGLGAGLIYIPSIAIQSHHWGSRRPLALGIIFSGSSVGGVVLPIMFNQLLAHGVGFGWSVRATAFVVVAALGSANFLMSPPSDPNATEKHPPMDWKSMATDLPYVLIIVGSFCCLWGIFYPYFYTQLYAITHGVDPTVAFYTLAILNVSSIPGRIIPNVFSHELGVFNMLLASSFGSAVVILSLLGIKSIGGIIVYAILSGFFSGAWFALVAAAMASFSRHPGEIGIRMGVAFAFSSCGSLTGTPIDGALLGHHFAWYKTVIFSGATILGGTAIIAVSRQLVVARKGTHVI
ncbi:major facilitator superfamily domain-containing protein [Amylostereum chailletii]|nr:major facilitator superfamily domain-containing protein [Amylostereum chailletii]